MKESRLRPFLLLFLLCFLVRWADVFFLELPVWVEELSLSKVVGLVLIGLYLILVRRSPGVIGITGRNLKPAILPGVLFITGSLAFAYGLDWMLEYANGRSPELIVAARGHALLPEQALAGGLVFGAVLFLGNLINSCMEEGLFRGVGLEEKSARANFIQASLFGLWHIVWPLKDYWSGKTDLSEFLIFSFGYILLSFLVGLGFGWLYLETKNLAAPWLAHTVNNTVLNFLHIQSARGFNPNQSVRVLASVIVFLAVLWLWRTMRKLPAAASA